MEQVPFIKMHGLGNDFVVLDARETPLPLTAHQAAAIADRRRGVGCDQLIVLERPRSDIADVFVRFHNSDGGALHRRHADGREILRPPDR